MKKLRHCHPMYGPIHRARKRGATIFLPLTFPNALTGFQTSFTNRLSGKFLTKDNKIGLLHFKRVATLPCEILMSEKQQQPETCIMINDTSQHSVTT